MPYSSILDRTGTEALIPEEVSREIIQGVPEESAVMRLARRLPNLARSQRRMPVLDTLITAYFVNGDTGLKQTSEVDWSNKNIDAEELAVIIPIPENVLDDADYDIWGEIKPRIVEAFGAAFDSAVLFGTNAPASWPDDLLTAAAAAGNTADLSTIIGASGDLFDAVMGESGVIAKVEEDGFMVNGHVAAMSMRAKLRGLRDSQKQPIFVRTMQEDSQYELDGSPVYFPKGVVNPSSALMFSGDWSNLVYALRQDVTYKLLTEAVIQDAAGNILYNLAQQDMVALRAVMRLGWQVPNPINRQQTNAASRYPFAVLVP